MEEVKWYFRSLGDGNFGFINSHDEILESDIEITEEEYKEFLKLQSKGEEFREKETHSGVGLFNLLEKYKSEQPKATIGQEEYLLDIEYRVSKIELGV